MKILSQIAIAGIFLLSFQSVETPKQRAERRKEECTKLLNTNGFRVQKFARLDNCIGQQIGHYLPGDTIYSMISNTYCKSLTSRSTPDLDDQVKEFTYLENGIPVYVVSEQYILEMKPPDKLKWIKTGTDYFVFDKGSLVEYGKDSEIITDERLKSNKRCIEMIECINERMKVLPVLAK